jgi:hypothetical protein
MNVTVVDTAPPEITCPPDVTVEQVTREGTVVPLTATATDICDPAPTITSNALPVYSLGTTTVIFSATDKSGNCASCPMDVTVVDTTPPVITCPKDVTVVQETGEGTVVPLTATATDICDPAPTITSNELPVYPLGTTTVTFSATDKSGNSASCSVNVTVIDTTPPEITIISPEEGMLYATTEIALEVTANEPISKWCYNLNEAGNVSFTHNTTITAREGENSLVVYAEDFAGNLGSFAISFEVDTIPPEITIISPVEGMTYDTIFVDLIYTVNELTRWVGYSRDGAEIEPLIGNITLEKLENGPHNLTIYAQDLAGNVRSNTVNFSVFTIAPTIWNIKVSPTYALPGESINISAEVFDHSGIRWARAFITKGGEDVRAFFLSGPGGTGGIYTVTWDTMIFTEGGIYNITISATDTEGNEAFRKAPEVAIPIDTEGPIVSGILVSPTFAEPGTLINISAEVFDNLSGVREVRGIINKEGEDVTTMFMADPEEDGIYTGTWRTMIFTEGGIYNINISATDNRGNEALAKAPDVEIREIPVDTEAPIISNIAVSPTFAEPGTPINIAAKVHDNLSRVREVRSIVNKEGEDVTAVFMSDPDEDGIYTGTWRTMFFTEGGTYNINISAADNRGNMALVRTPDVGITMDFEGPTISNVAASPSSGPPGTKINISAHVSDPSGIRHVRADINKEGEPLWTIFMLPSKVEKGVYTGTWHTMLFTEAGSYLVDIGATDERGNENLIKNAVEIEIIS